MKDLIKNIFICVVNYNENQYGKMLLMKQLYGLKFRKMIQNN